MKQPNLAVNNSLDIQKVYREFLRLVIKLRIYDTHYDFDLYKYILFAEAIHTIISYCYRIDKYGIV